MNKIAQIDFAQIEQAVGFGAAGGAFPTIGSIINTLMYSVMVIGAFLLLLYFISGGLRYMGAKGDPKATAAAQQTITHALLGFVIIFVSFWIVQIVGRVLGLQPIIDIFG